MVADGGQVHRIVGRDLPLIGRQAEFAALSGALEQAVAGRGGVAVVAGELGMGKTRVIEELVGRARELGMLVLVGRCWEGVDTPAFWPWIQVVRQARPTNRGSGLADGVLAELTALATERPDQGDERFATMDAVSSLLEELASSRPLLVVLEDVEQADGASVGLLHFLSKTLRDVPVMIVASLEEGAASRGAHSSIFSAVARESVKVALGPLDEESAGQLIDEGTGAPMDSGVRQGVLQASEGNPLFIIEAMRALDGPGGLFRPDHSTGFRVPSGVRDIISRRLEGLPPEVATLLSIASVLGRSFEVALLAEAADLDAEAVSELVNQAALQDVVIESSALGAYSFSHILIRETLYEGLTPANRMRLHRRAAELLESREGGAAELAHHWFKAAQAGDAAKAFRYLLMGAKDHMAASAYSDVARLCERALSAGAMAKVPEQQLAEVRTMLTQAREGANVQGSGSDTQHVFKREGDYWTVIFEGTTSRLKNLKGLGYLAILLANPRREVHVLDLVRPAVSSGRAEVDADLHPDEATGFEVLDAAARKAFKERIEDLRSDEQEATDFNDPERAARAREEIEQLLEQLASATGLGGKDRRTGSPAERARVSVNKAFKDALKRISDNDSGLGDHLSLTLKTGTYCSYSPDPRAHISWVL